MGNKNTEIGARIKARREELGYSQEYLGKLLGYQSRSAVCKIEKGTNDLRQPNIIIIAHALKTTPEWIMGWTENKDLASPEASEADLLKKRIMAALDSLSEDHLEMLLAQIEMLRKEKGHK